MLLAQSKKAFLNPDGTIIDRASFVVNGMVWDIKDPFGNHLVTRVIQGYVRGENNQPQCLYVRVASKYAWEHNGEWQINNEHFAETRIHPHNGYWKPILVMFFVDILVYPWVFVDKVMGNTKPGVAKCIADDEELKQEGGWSVWAWLDG